MNKLQQADRAHLLRHEIHKLAEQVKVSFVSLVRCLKEMRDNDDVIMPLLGQVWYN